MAEDISILQEIDDALRVDRAQQFWARHGITVLICCALIVLASAVSVVWRNHMHETHGEETTLLAQGTGMAQAGKYNDAIAIYEKVEHEGGSLAPLAGLRHAEALISLKQDDKALAMYDAVGSGKMGDGAPASREYAVWEATVIRRNQAMHNGKAITTEAVGGIYSQSVAELNALQLLKNGDVKAASTLLEHIVSDGGAPFSQRARAAELIASLKEDKK